jgi:hypothetical protein
VNGTIRANAIQVSGSFNSAMLNGEKPPYKVEVGNVNNTVNFHAVEVPSSIIQSYLGDANGGTIRLMMRVNSSDEVRVIDEMIYMEQPDKTLNASVGTSGVTYQSGGSVSQYILGNGSAYELCPNPWQWLWMRNYNSRGLPGLPGSNSAPFSGTDKFKFEILTAPNISATVIIYDR